MEPMSTAEFLQWVALITVIEPKERAEAQAAAKAQQGGM